MIYEFAMHTVDAASLGDQFETLVDELNLNEHQKMNFKPN
jgi:hypothetical protein